MKSYWAIIGLLVTINAWAQPKDSCEQRYGYNAYQCVSVSTRVSFKGSIEELLFYPRLKTLQLAGMDFENLNTSSLKGNLVYQGTIKSNRIGIRFEQMVQATLYVQLENGKSTDFDCPGSQTPGVTNARLVLNLIDDSGKQTLLNDNCIFFDKR